MSIATTTKTSETEAEQFDPNRPGSGVTPEMRANLEAFQKHVTTNVPFALQAEYVTTYGVFLVAEGKTPNEAADIAIASMREGDIIFRMFVSGAAWGATAAGL